MHLAVCDLFQSMPKHKVTCIRGWRCVVLSQRPLTSKNLHTQRFARHRQEYQKQSFSTAAPKKTAGPGLLIRRFINPWMDAVSRKNPVILAEKIDRYTEGFAVVSTLLCALSAAALANIPQSQQNEERRDKTSGDVPHTSILTSILRKHQMLPASVSDANILHDLYTCACCTSFFSGACALGLSTVINVVGTVAPRNYIQSGLILRHSLALSAIPFFAVVSGGFMGLALIVSIDMAVCSPTLTYIAIGQFGGTILLVAGTALRAQIGLVRAIAASATSATKRKRIRHKKRPRA